MYQNSFDQRRNTIRENSDNTHIFWIFLLHLTIKKEQQIKKNLPLSTLTHLLIVICNIFFLTTKATWRVLHHVEKWEKHFTLGRYYQLCVLSKISKGGRRSRAGRTLGIWDWCSIHGRSQSGTFWDIGKEG